MVQMLLAEGMLLCSLFWAFCWLGTGSDEKNIRNFSTYPDEVQILQFGVLKMAS